MHTELIGKLDGFGVVFNTPSHHRVHHGRNPIYLDRNHAGIFIIWDKMFGTFEPEAEAVDYGLTKNIYTYNPVRIAFHEWSSMLRDAWNAESLRGRLGYLLIFVQTWGASTRFVCEALPEGPTCTIQLPGGQSSHIDSPNYEDLLFPYLRNEPMPLVFDIDAAAASAARTVIFQ